MVLYVSFLADIGSASGTVASYMSAIRYVLRQDGIEINDKSCRLSAIIRACKLHNDIVTVRRPIRQGLLHLIIKKIDQRFLSKGQPYLATMYKAIFMAAYYGLFRISELVGKHAVPARDVHISKNVVKNKVKMVLHLSKTHHKGKRPQIVDIVSDRNQEKTPFDPYILLATYSKLRPLRCAQNEQYFVFTDGSKVMAHHV